MKGIGLNPNPVACPCGQPGTHGVFSPPPPGKVSWGVLVLCDDHTMSPIVLRHAEAVSPTPLTLVRLEVVT